MPYFRKAESQERGANDFHGGDGPLSVSDARDTHPMSEDFIAAAVAQGYPRNADFNGAEQEGFGPYQWTTRNGRRCSAAIAFLHPARGARQSQGGVECACHERPVRGAARGRCRL